jgi:hypothetical protein
VRKGRDYHAVADAIQDNHGSRKSGMPITGGRRRSPATGTPRKGKTSADQLNFDL